MDLIKKILFILLYNHSVSTKEEAFEMLKNNQEEYELLVQRMDYLIRAEKENWKRREKLMCKGKVVLYIRLKK